MNKVLFIGLGYIGLPTSAIVAGKGLQVLVSFSYKFLSACG